MRTRFPGYRSRREADRRGSRRVRPEFIQGVYRPQGLRYAAFRGSEAGHVDRLGTWFGIIAKPLFYVLTWTATHPAGNNFGWAIVLVTSSINMVLFPLRFRA